MSGTVKKKRKPPVAQKYRPTPEDRQKVEQMAAFGLTHEQIGSIMGISKKTVENHYPVELAQGVAKATVVVAQSLVRIATQGKGMPAVSAAIFFLKTRARWREVDRLEVTGADGEPLRLGVVAIPPKAASIEEWVRLQEERKALAASKVIDAEGE